MNPELAKNANACLFRNFFLCPFLNASSLNNLLDLFLYLLTFVSSPTNGQTTNFRLYKEQMVNAVRKILLFDFFSELQNFPIF
jgi:hypothetical protein